MLIKGGKSKLRVVSRHTNLHHSQALVYVGLVGMWVELRRFQEQYVDKQIAEANNVCNGHFTIKLNCKGGVLVTFRHLRNIGSCWSSGASAHDHGENIHEYS